MNNMLILAICLTASVCYSQRFSIPEPEEIEQSVDHYYSNNAEIQINELSQTRKFRWLSYLPSPGYSPFAGGFTLNMNLTAPLQEIRLNYSTKTRSEAIRQQSILQATDLKNSLTADRLTILNRIGEYDSRKSLDSLNRLAADLSARKYASNEITPTEFISASKALNEYMNSRQKEANAIHEAIHALRYKAKMPVAANNEHLISSHP
jgi:hypothetical protein